MKNEGIGKIYADGEIICSEGESGNIMYVIQSGKIKITKKSETGKDLTVATLKNGDFFGEMSLFDKLPRSATATAVGDVQILSIDKKKFFKTIDRDPTLVFNILESMSRRIRNLNEEYAHLKKSKLEMMKSLCDIEEICNVVLEGAKNIVKAENGSIMIREEDNHYLKIKAAFGTEADSKIEIKEGKGIAGDVLKTGMAELVNNVSMDSRFVSGKVKITSLICIPLKHKDTTFGVLNMSNSSETMFSYENLKLLNSMAINASNAIQNASIFSKLSNATDSFISHVTISPNI